MEPEHTPRDILNDWLWAGYRPQPFYTAMILLRTVLNREIWFDPLGKIFGGWGLYEDGQFTTESIENFMLFVPFSILLLWAFQKELLDESENIRFSGPFVTLLGIAMIVLSQKSNWYVANALAILEANEHTIYDPPAVFDSNKSEILLSTENKLKEIYEAFPNEGKVVLGYSYLVSWNYVTWLDFPRPIDEELIPLFKKWIRKFPENKLELMEYYSFILFEKWLYMDSLDNISEANKIYYEIKAIADELSKDYADNQVTQMLSMGIVRKL